MLVLGNKNNAYGLAGGSVTADFSIWTTDSSEEAVWSLE